MPEPGKAVLFVAERLFPIVEKAAAADNKCPSNKDLCTRLGCSPSTVVAAFSWLEAQGKIRLQRFTRSRIVTIAATGRSTRHSGQRVPRDLARADGGKPRPWQPGEDALLDRVRDDGAAAAELKRSRRAVQARRRMLAELREIEAATEAAPRTVQRDQTVAARRRQPPVIGPARTCMFIAGEYRYGDPDPYCGKPSAPGCSYCHEHRALCYEPPERQPTGLRKARKREKTGEGAAVGAAA